jgi:hypothetical protein
LDNAIKYYNKTKNYKGIIYGNDVLVSEYISNTLLFQGKKFHLRLYVIISITNNIFNSFLWDRGEIFTAKDMFDMNMPFTKEKHDTHEKTTNQNYSYPKSLTNDNLKYAYNEKRYQKHNSLYQDINKDIKSFHDKVKKICSVISKIIEKYKLQLLYPNEKNAYYLFGLDIMITDNWEPVFIEINENPGLGYENIEFQNDFSREYFQWLNDTVLEPLFKWNNPYKARTHPTYLSLF